ncbi:MAG: fructoselysine 6-kinase [Clostridiales bacterium]|nr:fructoselysine 6-kinase [Clostridiales bacterium]MDD7431794.1 fructoselysine 6-kinase [Clostridiales bacterium]MDY3062363.1 fructoselysine 6-kinase [Eubacteriales bacterium]
MNEPKAKLLACVGDNCVDYYEPGGHAYFGGNPLNVAVYAAEMGAEASYLGAVGNDRYGRELLSALKARRVDSSHVQILEGATALTHVTLEEGNRVFGDYEEGVMADFALRPEDYPFLARHRLIVSGLWGKIEKQLPEVRALQRPIAFDFAERPESETALIAAPFVDIAFFSDDLSDLSQLRERILQLQRLGPKLVIATRGEHGSLAFDGKDFIPQGIVPCPVVDTMGAGDSFIAGFLLNYLKGASLQACLAAGAAKSAETLSHPGAWS